MRYALAKGQSVVVFPESRHSNAGTTARLPGNMGKLAKIIILIDGPRRAEGLHKPLCQCKAFAAKYHMESQGTILRCGKCGAEWELSKDGWLVHADGKVHIPDWYEWEQEMAQKEIKPAEFQVTVEALPNEKGFIPLGRGKLKLDTEKFTLQLADRTLEFPADGNPVYGGSSFCQQICSCTAAYAFCVTGIQSSI